jgi:hypothetical protein
MLEHITSCENHNITKNWLLIMAGLCLLIGLLSGTNGGLEVFGPMGVVFGILFWSTRQNVIIIGSPSTKMLINVNGMKRQSVLDFINDIEQTKHKRVLTINNKV